jgi:hypothetical protein
MSDPRNLEHLEEINNERIELHKELCNFCGLEWNDTKEFTDNLPMTTVEQQADWLNEKIKERVEEYWWYITLNLYHDSWYLTYDFSKEDKERAHVKRKEYNDACIAVRDKRAGKELPLQKYREFLKIVDEVNEYRLIDNEKMIRLRKKMKDKPESVVDNRYYLQWIASYVGIPYEPLNSLIKKTVENKEWGAYEFNQKLLEIIRSYIKYV